MLANNHWYSYRRGPAVLASPSHHANARFQDARLGSSGTEGWQSTNKPDQRSSRLGAPEPPRSRSPAPAARAGVISPSYSRIRVRSWQTASSSMASQIRRHNLRRGGLCRRHPATACPATSPASRSARWRRARARAAGVTAAPRGRRGTSTRARVSSLSRSSSARDCTGVPATSYQLHARQARARSSPAPTGHHGGARSLRRGGSVPTGRGSAPYGARLGPPDSVPTGHHARLGPYGPSRRAGRQTRSGWRRGCRRGPAGRGAVGLFVRVNLRRWCNLGSEPTGCQ